MWYVCVYKAKLNYCFISIVYIFGLAVDAVFLFTSKRTIEELQPLSGPDGSIPNVFVCVCNRLSPANLAEQLSSALLLSERGQHYKSEFFSIFTCLCD